MAKTHVRGASDEIPVPSKRHVIHRQEPDADLLAFAIGGLLTTFLVLEYRMSNLSPLQRSILKWLLARLRFAQQHDQQLLKIGFSWEPHWKPKNGDRAEDKANENVWRASLCRALARLEKRGLVIRIKGRKKARTVRVLLTAKGQQVAQTLEGY